MRASMPLFTAALFTIAKMWKQPVSMNGWMNEVCVCVCIMDYLVIKEWNFAIYNKTDGLKGIMLSEMSQSKTNAIWSHLYVECGI